MKLINQNSFIITAAFLLAVFGFFAMRGGITSSRLVYLGALLLLSVLAFALLTPGTSSLTETERIEARIGGGVPVLLEFQSPY